MYGVYVDKNPIELDNFIIYLEISRKLIVKLSRPSKNISSWLKKYFLVQAFSKFDVKVKSDKNYILYDGLSLWYLD